jgi:hypothetical protein
LRQRAKEKEARREARRLCEAALYRFGRADQTRPLRLFDLQ